MLNCRPYDLGGIFLSFLVSIPILFQIEKGRSKGKMIVVFYANVRLISLSLNFIGKVLQNTSRRSMVQIRNLRLDCRLFGPARYIQIQSPAPYVHKYDGMDTLKNTIQKIRRNVFKFEELRNIFTSWNQFIDTVLLLAWKNDEIRAADQTS